MQQEKKLNDIIAPEKQVMKKSREIEVNNVELDLKPPERLQSNEGSVGSKNNMTPFINNSEKQDNDIFSSQLKKISHARHSTQDKPIVADNFRGSEDRKAEKTVPAAPFSNNFMKEVVAEQSSPQTESVLSANFPDTETKAVPTNKKSTFQNQMDLNEVSLGSSDSPVNKVSKVTGADTMAMTEAKRQPQLIQEAIKEVDESENQTIDQIASPRRLSTPKVPQEASRSKEDIELEQKNYIRDQVNKIWDKYDLDQSGVLDKIESANFLNEILIAQNMGPPTMEMFNRFFAEFDINNDGVIQRSEMARFIKRFIYGDQKSLSDSSSLI